MTKNNNGTNFSIECEDIILMEYRAEDLDAIHTLTWQPEIYEFLPGWNVPREQRQEWLVQYEIPENKQFLQAVADGGHIGDLRLRLGIVTKATGELVGWCCTGPKEELPDPNREVMYAMSKDYRGKGYTTQAVLGLIRFLFEKTDAKVLSAVALTHNTASNKVLGKCGFIHQGILEIDGEPYHYYRIEKMNWMESRRS